MKRKLNIAITHPHFNTTGGAENFILNVAEIWLKLGHKVTILSASFTPEIAAMMRRLGLNLVTLGIPFIETADAAPRNVAFMAWRLHRKCRGYDVLFLNNFPSTVWGGLAKTKYHNPVPMIWICHEPQRTLYSDILKDVFNNIDQKTAQEKQIRRLDQEAVLAMDAVVTNSKFTASMIKDIYNFTPDTCLHGIPLPKKKRLIQKKSSPFIVGNVGRLEAGKNNLSLISAIQECLRLRPDMRHDLCCILVGTGSQEMSLREAIQQQGLEDIIQIKGFLSDKDLDHFYQALNLLVYVPFNEPLGRVPLEAGLRGIPCIVSNEGGPLEVVRDKETGFHVIPTDVTAIAEKIIKVYQDHKLRENMEKAAQDHVHRAFNIERTASYLLAVAENLF